VKSTAVNRNWAANHPGFLLVFRKAKMQSSKLAEALKIVSDGHDLTESQMHELVGEFLSGDSDQGLTRSFLVALAEKQETVDELVGAARAMRDAMIRVECSQRPVIDTCGTGGDGSKTFNISTAAAIAVAATGLPVAKHGNRKITSATGSADVLAELGLNLDADVKTVESCLNRVGLCFCFAPLFHPAMRFVGEVRRSIPHPTIFNRLGPLCNPASAECQVLGVGDKTLQIKLASTLQRLGTKRSLVVRGEDGVDELSLSAHSVVFEVTPDAMIEHRWHPSDFGLEVAHRDTLYANDPTSSANCIREVLDGVRGPRRDAVVLNAACGLWIAGVSSDLKECSHRVQAAIDSHRARAVLMQCTTHLTSHLTS
jgi:anthranilate phosphoribosyltransferase